jgi:hypothetical protein
MKLSSPSSQGLASLKQEMARLDSYIESRKVYSEYLFTAIFYLLMMDTA